jgi:hypothetical protein
LCPNLTDASLSSFSTSSLFFSEEEKREKGEEEEETIDGWIPVAHHSLSLVPGPQLNHPSMSYLSSSLLELEKRKEEMSAVVPSMSLHLVRDRDIEKRREEPPQPSVFLSFKWLRVPLSLSHVSSLARQRE